MWARRDQGLLAAGLALAAVVAWSSGLMADAVSEREVAFDSDSYTLDEPAVFHVRDSALSTLASCTATWGVTASNVPTSDYWSLATGHPFPSQFSLSEGCTYDRSSPAETPIDLPITVTVDGVGQFIADFDPEYGEIYPAFEVNASSTVAIVFSHEQVDRYTADDRVVRVHSQSDPDGEWASLTEVVDGGGRGHCIDVRPVPRLRIPESGRVRIRPR